MDTKIRHINPPGLLNNPAFPQIAAAGSPPAISVLIVAGLANPDFLVEIDATAFILEKAS
jgi:enamine deaminase RidA (YjgF/YER057c/UK114 family)